MNKLYFWLNDEIVTEIFETMEELENFIENFEVEVFKID